MMLSEEDEKMHASLPALPANPTTFEMFANAAPPPPWAEPKMEPVAVPEDPLSQDDLALHEPGYAAAMARLAELKARRVEDLTEAEKKEKLCATLHPLCINCRSLADAGACP